MKKFYLLACILGMALTHNAGAQAPGIDWKNVYPYVGYGSCAEPTSDGGYIIGAVYAGRFLTFKVDNTGAQQWNRWITSGTGATTVYAVKQTTDNGYIVAGSDMIFGSPDSIGNHGIRDFMVTKLNSSGTPSWIKCLGGTNNEEAASIEQTSDGGYIVAGYAGSNDDDVSGWHGNTDYWVVKLDASGNITWQKALGGANYDYAKSVIQTSDGGYIVAGYSGSKDGDVTGTHWGGSDDDVWVVKLDASGAITWQKSYGGSKADQAFSIRQTTDGGYIVAGNTTSNDGDVTGKHGTTQDNQDYWVLKLNATGTLIWQKCLGGTGPGIGAGSGNDFAYDVRQTTDGGYVVAGTVNSNGATNDDITGYHGATGSDYWIVKLDTVGSITWQKCLGGNGTEDARSIAQTPDGGYIIAGTTIYSPAGDVSAPDYSSNYPWIVKLGGVTGVEEFSGSFSFEVYPNPATDVITIADVPAGSILNITDLTGKLIYSAVLANPAEKVSTANFANGMYMIRVTSNRAVSNKKLIINK